MLLMTSRFIIVMIIKSILKCITFQMNKIVTFTRMLCNINEKYSVLKKISHKI